MSSWNKKAKKMKQEDEMAERMAKKFGITTISNTSNSEQHSGSSGDGNNKSSGLHNALAKFLAMAGDSMSTWMLQSMSTTASEDLHCQYADECICKKILQMRSRNAALESSLPAAEVVNKKNKNAQERDSLVAATSLLTMVSNMTTKTTHANHEDEKQQEETKLVKMGNENKEEEDIYGPLTPHDDNQETETI